MAYNLLHIHICTECYHRITIKSYSENFIQRRLPINYRVQFLLRDLLIEQSGKHDGAKLQKTEYNAQSDKPDGAKLQKTEYNDQSDKPDGAKLQKTEYNAQSDKPDRAKLQKTEYNAP